MGRWCSQTKQAKDAMESCGWKWRRDFTVKTDFDRRVMGYTEAHVCCWRNLTVEQMRELADTGDLNVTALHVNGRVYAIITSGTGRFEESRR